MDLLHWLEANIINHKTILHRKSALKYSTDFYITMIQKNVLIQIWKYFHSNKLSFGAYKFKKINNFERLFLNHVILGIR